jgi:hypothetical protein
MDSLFRKEAMQARSDLWLGSVQLRPAVSYTYLAFCCVFILTGLLILLFEGTFSRKIHLDGDLALYPRAQMSSLAYAKPTATPIIVAHFLAPLHYIRSLVPGEPVNLAYDGLPLRNIGITGGGFTQSSLW